MNSWKCHCVQYGMWEELGMKGQTQYFVPALFIQYLQLLCVCTVTMDYTTTDLKEESYSVEERGAQIMVKKT